jgi:peptide deformylase
MKLTKRVLNRRAKPVEFEWPVQNQMLADHMLAFMRQEKGIGLAAPQIGRSVRVFVMEVDGQIRSCFNPEILNSSITLSDFDEGCLSFPGGSCTIKRPDTITVKYQDAHGSWTEAVLRGLESRCFQHELDHLNGKTMYDRQKEQHAEQS